MFIWLLWRSIIVWEEMFIIIFISIFIMCFRISWSFRKNNWSKGDNWNDVNILKFHCGTIPVNKKSLSQMSSVKQFGLNWKAFYYGYGISWKKYKQLCILLYNFVLKVALFRFLLNIVKNIIWIFLLNK